MEKLEAEYFFDLISYRHSKLFENNLYVWEALAKIASYLETYSYKKNVANISEGAYLINPELISIGKGSLIEPGAYIKGPCILGENCTVRHGAYIRGNFIAGDNCVIGHDTEVKNSIFLNDVHAAHFAYVGDSILGNHVNLGAGTKCANLKFDNSIIVINVENKNVGTGLRKLGAILGDFSQTGCNSVTNPGTVLGKQVFCYPCVNVGGFVSSKSVVKSTEKIIISPFVETVSKAAPRKEEPAEVIKKNEPSKLKKRHKNHK